MSPDRFAFGIDLLNGPTGANRQATSFPRSTGAGGELVASQLFLGAEVDIAPEMVPNETSSYRFCLNVPDFLKYLDQKTFLLEQFWCEGGMVDPQPDGRLLLRDVQGPDRGSLLSTRFYARQHLLHLPVDGQRKSAFIASNTSKYGGGTRRLGEILDVELDQRQKGYIFLAHPFAEGQGDGVGGLGPDLIQYTQTQLDDAFDSPYVLGLQIWNEDSLSSATANDAEPFPSPLWQDQTSALPLPPLPEVGHPAAARSRHGAHGLALLARFRSAATLLRGGRLRRPRRLQLPPRGLLLRDRQGQRYGDRQAPQPRPGRRTVGRGDLDDGGHRPAVLPGPGRGRPAKRKLRAHRRPGRAGDGRREQQRPDRRLGCPDGQRAQASDQWPVPGDRRVDVVARVRAGRGGRSAGRRLGEGLHQRHGLHAGLRLSPASNLDKTFPQRGTDKVFVETPNIPYWYDPNPQNALFVDPTAAEAYYGRRSVTIDPAKYPVGIGDCIRPNSNTVLMATGGGTTAGSEGTVVYLKPSLEKELADLANGIFEPVPACPDGREFLNATTPDRMFVRAEVRNEPAPDSNAFCSDVPHPILKPCVRRVAYTNPVWVNIVPCVSPLTCAYSNVQGTVVSTSSTMPQLSPATLTSGSVTMPTTSATLTTTTRQTLATSTATLTTTTPTKVVTSSTTSRLLTTTMAR